MYQLILKPFLFLFPPEKAHHFSLSLFRFFLIVPGAKWICKILFVPPVKAIEQFGLKFSNPVGLAAGFDKDGKYIDLLPYLGFGFIELGTVTPLPQKGNPQPRLFRLPKDQALINRMGFNNEGVDALVDRLKKHKSSMVIGGNIGKNKLTPNDQAVEDYVICFNKLFDHVNYFVVNVSSPNTPGLRDLQDKGPLTNILKTLQEINLNKQKPKPLFLKIAPDLTEGQLEDIVDIIRSTKLTGIVATNTTISREKLITHNSKINEIGNGGLSGRPVLEQSNRIIKYLRSKLGNSFPIIGVGGIHDVSSAKGKFEAGASLVQIYTGFIYQGPTFIRRIIRSLDNS